MSTNVQEVVLTRELGHIYGRSYFGSGACWGQVFCCINCVTEGVRDNGFVSGPDLVRVIDPSKSAHFVARGGDNVNGGRTWREEATWLPSQQAWWNDGV